MTATENESTLRYFAYKLIPPRRTFAHDMTDAEAQVMGRHGAYWSDLVRQGTALVFGPVLDPDGTWGLAVVRAASSEDVEALGTGDPAVAEGVATFVVCDMPQTIVAPGFGERSA
jgi:uncharacterized protein YciI